MLQNEPAFYAPAGGQSRTEGRQLPAGARIGGLQPQRPFVAGPRRVPLALRHVHARPADPGLHGFGLGREGAVDLYAAENPAEFFAVTSELFFEQPDALHGQYPGVYRQLAAFYRQDPMQRGRRSATC